MVGVRSHSQYPSSACHKLGTGEAVWAPQQQDRTPRPTSCDTLHCGERQTPMNLSHHRGNLCKKRECMALWEVQGGWRGVLRSLRYESHSPDEPGAEASATLAARGDPTSQAQWWERLVAQSREHRPQETMSCGSRVEATRRAGTWAVTHVSVETQSISKMCTIGHTLQMLVSVRSFHPKYPE